MSQIFVLKHFYSDIDNFKIFTNVDSALDTLRAWLRNDANLMSYSLSKYELDEVSQEYCQVNEYDLDELIEVDVEDGSSDVLSIIDSDVEDG